MTPINLGQIGGVGPDFTRTHCRKTDPSTSQKAAERARSFSGGHCLKILSEFDPGVGLTANELARYTGLTVEQVCRRLPDLEAANELRPTGQERDGFRVWVLIV